MAPVSKLDFAVTDVTPSTWNELSADLSMSCGSTGGSCGACSTDPCCTHCGDGNCGCCI